MKEQISQILKEYIEMKEMGIDVNRLQKTLPKNYISQSATQRKKNAIEYESIKKLKILRQQILDLIKNLNWQELSIKGDEYRQFFFKFPKKVYNLMNEYQITYRQIDNVFVSTELNNFDDDIDEFRDIDIGLTSHHKTEFPDGIPNSFKGFNLGFKLYRRLLSKVGYIHSDENARKNIHNIYYQLIKEKDINCVVTKKSVLVMEKSLTKDKKVEVIKEFLTYYDPLFYNKNVVFDGALQKQIGINVLKEMVKQSRFYITKGYYPGEDKEVNYRGDDTEY